MLHSFRSFEQQLFDPIVVALKNFNPNMLTFVSLLAGVVGGLLLLLPNYFLLAAALFIMISGLFDLLDGNLARKYKKHTKRGDFLDWVADRYVDLFIMLGITYSSYVTYREIGFIALIGIFLVSFIGSRVEIGGSKPIASGISSRADRTAIIVLFVIAQFFLLNFMGSPKIFGLWLFDWLLIYLAIASHITALYRAVVGWGILKKLDLSGKQVVI